MYTHMFTHIHTHIMHTDTLSLTCACRYTHTVSHTCTLSLSLSLSLTHTHSHTHTDGCLPTGTRETEDFQGEEASISKRQAEPQTPQGKMGSSPHSSPKHFLSFLPRTPASWVLPLLLPHHSPGPGSSQPRAAASLPPATCFLLLQETRMGHLAPCPLYGGHVGAPAPLPPIPRDLPLSLI